MPVRCTRAPSAHSHPADFIPILTASRPVLSVFQRDMRRPEGVRPRSDAAIPPAPTTVDMPSRCCPAAYPCFACHGKDLAQTLGRGSRQTGSPQRGGMGIAANSSPRTWIPKPGSPVLDPRACGNEVAPDVSGQGKAADSGLILRRRKQVPGLFLVPPYLQQQAADRMPERALAHGACGYPRTAGGPAQRLQRALASQRDQI